MKPRILFSILIGIGLFFISCNPAPTIEKDGGIRVVVKISYRSFFKALVGEYDSKSIDPVLDAIESKEAESIEMYLTNFINAEQQIATDLNLVSLFFKPEFQGRLSYNSSNQDVINVLKKEWEDACNTMAILIKSRIVLLGYENAIVVQSSDNELTIEIPGLNSIESINNVIFARGELGFWETFENKDCFEYMNDVNEYLKKNMDLIQEPGDSVLMDSVIAESPLFWLLSPVLDHNSQLMPGSVVGYVLPENKPKIEKLLANDSITIFFRRDCKFLWSKEMGNQENPYYELVALRADRSGGPILSGDVVTKAEVDGNNGIMLQMNSEGAHLWKRITAENIGLNIAMTIDDVVYSHPTVQGEIEGGRSSIAGNFTFEESQNLAIIVQSGKYPLPLQFVKSEVLDPK